MATGSTSGHCWQVMKFRYVVENQKLRRCAKWLHRARPGWGSNLGFKFFEVSNPGRVKLFFVLKLLISGFYGDKRSLYHI